MGKKKPPEILKQGIRGVLSDYEHNLLSEEQAASLIGEYILVNKSLALKYISEQRIENSEDFTFPKLYWTTPVVEVLAKPILESKHAENWLRAYFRQTLTDSCFLEAAIHINCEMSINIARKQKEIFNPEHFESIQKRKNIHPAFSIFADEIKTWKNILDETQSIKQEITDWARQIPFGEFLGRLLSWQNRFKEESISRNGIENLQDFYGNELLWYSDVFKELLKDSKLPENGWLTACIFLSQKKEQDQKLDEIIGKANLLLNFETYFERWQWFGWGLLIKYNPPVLVPPDELKYRNWLNDSHKYAIEIEAIHKLFYEINFKGNATTVSPFSYLFNWNGYTSAIKLSPETPAINPDEFFKIYSDMAMPLSNRYDLPSILYILQNELDSKFEKHFPEQDKRSVVKDIFSLLSWSKERPIKEFDFYSSIFLREDNITAVLPYYFRQGGIHHNLFNSLYHHIESQGEIKDQNKKLSDSRSDEISNWFKNVHVASAANINYNAKEGRYNKCDIDIIVYEECSATLLLIEYKQGYFRIAHEEIALGQRSVSKGEEQLDNHLLFLEDYEYAKSILGKAGITNLPPDINQLTIKTLFVSHQYETAPLNINKHQVSSRFELFIILHNRLDLLLNNDYDFSETDLWITDRADFRLKDLIDAIADRKVWILPFNERAEIFAKHKTSLETGFSFINSGLDIIVPRNALEHFNKGVELSKEKKWREAETEIDKVLEYFPGYADAHHLRGNFRAWSGNMEGSIVDLNFALSKLPDHLQVWKDLSLSHYEGGNLEDSILTLEKAIIKFPYEGDLYSAKVKLELEKQKFLNRDGTLNESATLSADDDILYPTMQTVQNDLAYALQLSSNSDNAFVLYQLIQQIILLASGKSISTDSPDLIKNRITFLAIAYKTQATLENKNFTYTTAIKLVNKLIDIYPNDADSYSTRAWWMMHNGLENEALKNFQKAISINPQNADLLDKTACLMDELGFIEEALRLYDDALLVDPTFSRAYYNKGVILQKQKSYEAAIEAFSNAINLEQQLSENWTNFDLKSRVILAQVLFDSLHNRSCAYRNLGKESEAINDLKIAAQLGSVNAIKQYRQIRYGHSFSEEKINFG